MRRFGQQRLDQRLGAVVDEAERAIERRQLGAEVDDPDVDARQPSDAARRSAAFIIVRPSPRFC